MGLTGSGVGIPNHRFQFLLIVFMGIIALGSVLYWRQKTLVSADYTDFPQRVKKVEKTKLHSKNFQIDTEEVSPSLK